jgi:Fe-S cluster assembly protein SufD
LPNGAFVGRIRDGLISHGEVLEKSLASRIKASDDPFEALNTANLSDGALIYVPAGKAIESLIEIIFLTDGSELEAQVLSHPRWLVVAESGAVVRLAVQFIGVPDQEMYLNNAVYEIQAGENANIQQTILIQEYDDKGMTLLKGKATLAAGSQVSMFALTLGGAMVRHCLEADLEGENADCTMNGLSIVRNSRHVHNHPTVRHQAGNASSRQLFKAILNEQAQSEFDGTIVVAKDANGTNAQQLSRNLVLSGEAQVFTRPWLQIDADDVKCSHGATVGQLEENELFYLASRGIDANSARALLTYGFAEDMLTDVSPKPLRENLERRLLAVLGQTPVQ